MTSVTVTPSAASIVAGSILPVAAMPLDAAGYPLFDRAAIWTSSDPAIATVASTSIVTGAVTGVAGGIATITATSENHSNVVTVTVIPLAIDTIIVTPSPATVTVGQTLQLAAAPKDANGNTLTGRTVTWSTSNSSLATVSASGLVTAVAAGMAGITATSEGKQTTVTITVMPPLTAPVTTVTVTPATAGVVAGQTVQLTASPRDASGDQLSGRTVTWASSNTSIAPVSSSGLVTGVAPGSTVITATSEGQHGVAAVSVTTATTTTNPGVVADLAVAGVTDNSVTLSFTEVDNGTGLPATYDVRFALAPLAWGSAASVARGTCAIPVTGTAIGARRSCTVEGLTASRSYQFQLVAFRGTLNVDAVFGALSNVASATTAGSTAPVASVVVNPTSVTLAIGATQQLSVVLRDGSGGTLSGRPVQWSSSSTAVATVSPAGLVTGVSGGSATITATSEGKSGSAAVTVGAPSGNVECATPRTGWIWCDDFEQDRLSRYFEYDNASGNFVRAAGVGLDGSSGMRARWPTAGQIGAGALHLAFGKTPQPYFRPVDAGTAHYRDVYWRMYFRNQPGWTGGGADKLSRATVFASSSTWAQAMIAHVWSGVSPNQNYLVIDPASGTDASGTVMTTTYNDFANLRWLGAARGTTPVFDASHVGQWYCVEAHVKLNDSGVSNGVFELWVNGALEAQRSGLNWLGSFNAYGINAVFIENYWNAGTPQAQERYIDNVVVSTGRVGCLGSAPPPPPPAAVATVSVAPTTVGIAVGQTVPLTVTLHDANGFALTGRTVTWASSNAAVATVSSSGVVAGVAAGSVTITATSEGKTGTATVTVAPATPAGSWPNEPAGLTVLSDNPWNSLSQPGWYWYDPLKPGEHRIGIASDASAPRSPSQVLEFAYPAGQIAGSGGGATGYGGYPYGGADLNRGELFAAFYFKHSPNWESTGSAMTKMFYLFQYLGTNRQASFLVLAGVTGGPYALRIVNEAGGGQHWMQNVSDIPIVPGNWYRLELYLKKASTSGAADGIVRWWVNGVLAANHTSANLRGEPFSHFHVGPVWGGLGGTTTQNLYLRYDHIYLSAR